MTGIGRGDVEALRRGAERPPPVNGDDALLAEMRQLWDDEIVTTTPRATILHRLPPEVVRFVEEVGLPQAVPAFDFDLVPPEVWMVVALGGANRDGGLGEFLVLCHRRADIALGIDLATGRVFTVDLRGEELPAFANSSRSLYVRFARKGRVMAPCQTRRARSHRGRSRDASQAGGARPRDRLLRAQHLAWVLRRPALPLLRCGSS